MSLDMAPRSVIDQFHAWRRQGLTRLVLLYELNRAFWGNRSENP